MNHFKSIGMVVFALGVACGGGKSQHGGGGTQGTGGEVGSGGVSGTGGGTPATVAPGSGGSGGVTGVGGTGGWGGSTATGGSLAAGGTTGTGGTKATGGASSRGGTTGTGGAQAAGGATPAGGTKGTGGATSTGPVTGTGGTKATGGATGSGGTAGTGATTAAIDGGAAGLPYKGVASCTCAERTSLKVSWYYNWTVSPDSCTTGGEFVPMYSNHPNTNPTADAVAAQITKLVNAGYKDVLGFNEPNKSDQANMTVADAIALWPAMTSNPNILVGSPATSADGQSWFTDFMNQVTTNGLRVDFIALHWYGWNAGSCDAKAANLESYIKWAENIPGNRPLWLTEWGCMNASNPDVATVQAFFLGAVAMFAKHPRLERYAWYQWDTNNELTNSDHSLTALGTVYASQPSTR